MARRRKVVEGQQDLFAPAKQEPPKEPPKETPAAHGHTLGECSLIATEGMGPQTIHEYYAAMGLKIGDAVYDNDNYRGVVAEPRGEQFGARGQIAVQFGPDHPLAWLNRPIVYAGDRIRKVNP